MGGGVDGAEAERGQGVDHPQSNLRRFRAVIQSGQEVGVQVDVKLHGGKSGAAKHSGFAHTGVVFVRSAPAFGYTLRVVSRDPGVAARLGEEDRRKSVSWPRPAPER